MKEDYKELLKKSDIEFTLKSGDEIVYSTDIWGKVLGTDKLVLVRVIEEEHETLQFKLCFMADSWEASVDFLLLQIRERETGKVWFTKEFHFEKVHLGKIDALEVTISLDDVKCERKE